MTDPQNDSRINIRVSTQEKELLQAAAKSMRMSLTAFLLLHGLEQARQIQVQGPEPSQQEAPKPEHVVEPLKPVEQQIAEVPEVVQTRLRPKPVFSREAVTAFAAEHGVDYNQLLYKERVGWDKKFMES